MSRPALHLFEAYGVELEYMIVDARTLDILPISDLILRDTAGKVVDNIDRPGGITWSNELVLHVLELKATRPLPSLNGAATEFQQNVREVNALLDPLGARLMPSAMHPWMDPRREMVLWPHEYHTVYETFHRLFDCRGHGWANLQSVHLNLPFCGDEEFGQLHAAIRFLLPILPALAASSPVVEDKITGIIDNRLEMYRANSASVPSLAGQIIPEPVFTRREYEESILERIYADVAPHDPEGILRGEFLNARGAIARFGRGAIEIRLLDAQECPQADVALCEFISAVLRWLLRDPERLRLMREYPTAPLHELLLSCIRDGERTRSIDPEYPAILGVNRTIRACGDFWDQLFDRVKSEMSSGSVESIATILEHGSLARRLLNALGQSPSRARLREVFGYLCDCLQSGRQFLPGG